MGLSGVSATQASSVAPFTFGNMEPKRITVNLQLSKTGMDHVTVYMYITHLHCLAVQAAGFYSDVVECLLSMRENMARTPSGKKDFSSPVTFGAQRELNPMIRAVIPRVYFHDKLYGLVLHGRSPIWCGGGGCHSV